MDELVFKYIEIGLAVAAPFGLLNRGQDTVGVLVRDSFGQWVLGKKERFYPEGIVRMLGGGIDSGENPLEGAQRELAEEVGVRLEESRLTPLIHAEVTGHLPNKSTVNASVFVFYAQVGEVLKAQDDISGLAHLSDHDMTALIERYAELPNTEVIRDDSPDATWSDYGKIWGPIHQAAWERVKELGL